MAPPALLLLLLLGVEPPFDVLLLQPLITMAAAAETKISVLKLDRVGCFEDVAALPPTGNAGALTATSALACAGGSGGAGGTATTLGADGAG